MHHRPALFPACILVVLATACASPSSQFYTLSSSAAATRSVSSTAVTVGPVSVPTVVDRPQIVLSTGTNQVRLDEFNRWASPLAENISRVVAANLALELGTPNVWAFGQTTPSTLDYRVLIDVQRFHSVLGEGVEIDALWTVRPAEGGTAKTARSLVREPTSGAGFEPLVAAHSRALARLSAEIAAAIRAP